MIQGSPEWHEWRMRGVGASEVPAILGVCPYNTAHDIWLVKTGRKKGFEGNSFTQHGQETEGRARARYEIQTMQDMAPACATHPKFTMCAASLDGLSEDGKLVLEIKCPKGADVLAQAKAGKVAEHYWPQVQYQLAVTGADLLHFFVYHSDTEQDALVEVKPDVEYQGMIVAKVLAFWDLVKSDTPPPLTDRDAKIITDDDGISGLCQQLVSGQKTFSKQQMDALKAQIVKLAGHPKMKCGNVQISTVNRNGKFSFHKLTVSQGE